VLVCGSFAVARGFIELLSAKLPLDVALWNPVVRMHCEGDRQSEAVLQRVGPSMAIAAGLAMRMI
jgi:Tfp pilus assembly PilM family ATPase